MLLVGNGGKDSVDIAAGGEASRDSLATAGIIGRGGLAAAAYDLPIVGELGVSRAGDDII